MRNRRHAKSYERRAPTREPYDVVLIVCEGKKTEPLYLNRLRILHRLSSANIQVLSADGTDPINIVAFTERQLQRGIYDKAFCVFDRNGHANYDSALQRISASADGKKGKLEAITSWPCFEVWLLLHFRYSAAAFQRSGRHSSCDKVIRELKAYLPLYEKGSQSIYDELLPRQADAMRHADRLEKENLITNSSNPSTRLHYLVSYLQSLRVAK